MEKMNLISTFSKINNIEIPFEVVSEEGDVAVSIANTSLMKSPRLKATREYQKCAKTVGIGKRIIRRVSKNL